MKVIAIIISVMASVVGCDIGSADGCYYCSRREKTQCWSCDGRFQTCVTRNYEVAVSCRSNVDGICFDAYGESQGICRDSSDCRADTGPVNEICR
jgi:hypothetical protein